MAACDVPPSTGDLDGPVILGSVPAAGDVDVPRLGVFVAFVDRQLLPRTVNRGTVRVRSGSISHPVSVRFDPVERAIIARTFDGEPLEAEVGYRFVVDGVRDLADRQIEGAYTARFRTSDELGEPPPVPSAPFSAIEPILRERCATAGCHVGEGAPFGLDLSSPDAIRRTAIGRRSPRLGGTTGPDADRGSLFLGSLPIVDVIGGVGSPEGSLLVYKVLGDSHVLGDVMPPPEAGPALSEAEIQSLGAWILGGAPTP